jgi:L-lactate utilization protein LutB
MRNEALGNKNPEACTKCENLAYICVCVCVCVCVCGVYIQTHACIHATFVSGDSEMKKEEKQESPLRHQQAELPQIAHQV